MSEIFGDVPRESAYAADRLQAIFSGFSPAARMGRQIAMLQVYADDSKSREEVLVLAGYVGHLEQWQKFSVEWQRLLDEHPKWDEFKMKRAARHPERALKFYRVVEKYAAVSVACVVEIQALRTLCDEFALPDFCRNPYNWAFKALPGATYMRLGNVGAQYPMEFIFDDRGEERTVRDAWPFFFMGMPSNAQRIMSPAKPRFERSHEVLPLQAAEIAAWHARKHWVDHKKFESEAIELSWPEATPMKGLLTHWNYETLKPNMQGLRALLEQIKYQPLDPLPEQPPDDD